MFRKFSIYCLNEFLLYNRQIRKFNEFCMKLNFFIGLSFGDYIFFSKKEKAQTLLFKINIGFEI